MFHNHKNALLKSEDFAALGSETIAYVREISGKEVQDAFSAEIDLELDTTYWGLFSADGQPLMFASQADQVLNGAFYNDLHAVLLN